MRRACLTVLLVCGTASITAAQSAERFTLRGQIVDGATGRPLPDLQISIRKDPELQPATEPVVSGPDGRFVFYGLEAGRYSADTWLNGEMIHYRELPPGTVGATDVGPDFRDAEFTFRATRHPTIEGIVRDEFGDPVPHADVTALLATWADGRVVQTRLMQTVTDDRGHYRLSALAPGACSVCAEFINSIGNEWFRAIAPEASSTVDFVPREAPRFYKRTCYPGEPPASFKVDWGQDLNVDLKLGSTPAIKVRGRVTNWKGSGMLLMLVPEDETVSNPPPSIQPDGTFEFSVLEPGRYVLQAAGFDENDLAEMAQQTVVVEKAPVNGLQLTTQPVAQIPVLVQGPATPAIVPGSVSIGLREVDSRRGNTYWALRGGDGSFKFQVPGSGTYWVLSQTGAPFCVESLTFGGRPVLHDRITFSPGDAGSMEVVLSTQCAGIQGKVLIPEGSGPYPFLTMMMSGTAQSPGEMLNILLNEDGSFSVDRLPPGRYHLWAWSQNDLGFPGPASLAEVANQATVVEVGKVQRATTQVRLLPGHTEAK